MSMLLHPAAVMQLQKDSIHGAIQAVNQGAGLQHCWDVANGQSYDGSSQVWTDTVAGYNLNRGADASATATDPTFNGTVNSRDGNTYWSFDGGDYFTPVAGGAGSTFIQTIHKNNAVYTISIWGRLGTHSPSNQYLIGNTQGSTSTGFFFGFSTAAGLGNGRLRFAIYNGATSVLDVGGASPFALPSAGSWYFWAVSVDEVAGTGFLYQNGSVHTFTSTYASPSSSNSSNILTVGAINAVLPLTNGSRMGNVSFWDRSLSQSDLDAIFNRTRGGYGV